MKNLLRYAMLMLVVALVGSAVANAAVPEVDPSQAISGFAFLAVAVTVLRARRSK